MSKKVVIKQSIADALRQLRKERGLSQYQLAKVLDVSPATVCLWESGNRFPNSTLRDKICSYFNVDMNFLCGFSKFHVSVDDEKELYSVALYDRTKLKSHINSDELSFNKDIFNSDEIIANMKLPITYFRKNASYFALKCKEPYLNYLNIKVGDILFFVQASATDVEDNTVVCAYLNGKVVIKLFQLGDSSCYYLADGFEDKKRVIIEYSSNEVIIGKLCYIFSSF